MTIDGVLRWWGRWRYLVVLLAVCGLVVGTLLALIPDKPSGQVLVVDRALNTGDPLAATDVTTVAVDPQAQADDAFKDLSQLPPTWEGPPIATGTVLTESLVMGSPAGRELAEDEVQVIVTVAVETARNVDIGDHVDLWSLPGTCEDVICVARLLAPGVRISSVLIDEEAGWSPTQGARVGVILPSRDTGQVLGFSESNRLTLVLRHSPV